MMIGTSDEEVGPHIRCTRKEQLGGRDIAADTLLRRCGNAMPLKMTDDSVERRAAIVGICVPRPYRHDPNGLRYSNQRQGVVQGAGGFAGSVPSDQDATPQGP